VFGGLDFISYTNQSSAGDKRRNRRALNRRLRDPSHARYDEQASNRRHSCLIICLSNCCLLCPASSSSQQATKWSPLACHESKNDKPQYKLHLRIKGSSGISAQGDLNVRGSRSHLPLCVFDSQSTNPHESRHTFEKLSLGASCIRELESYY
jgi:hypothetical protein